MALDDRLAELAQTLTPGGCSFGKFLTGLPEGTRELLEQLLASKMSNQTLRTTLAVEGHRFSRDTIADHRHGRCLCLAERTAK